MSSPEEADDFFPYVPEPSTQIQLVSPDNQLVQTLSGINNIQLVLPPLSLSEDLYDGDTEDNVDLQLMPIRKLHYIRPRSPLKLHRSTFRSRQPQTQSPLVKDSSRDSPMSNDNLLVCDPVPLCPDNNLQNSHDSDNLVSDTLVHDNDHTVSVPFDDHFVSDPHAPVDDQKTVNDPVDVPHNEPQLDSETESENEPQSESSVVDLSHTDIEFHT